MMKLYKNKFNLKVFIDKASLFIFYRLAFPSEYNLKDNSIISLGV